jgi:uncharacterized protein (DUF433 family)
VYSRSAGAGGHRRREVADGMTVEEVLADFPDLEAEDVLEALRYAAERPELGRD